MPSEPPPPPLSPVSQRDAPPAAVAANVAPVPVPRHQHHERRQHVDIRRARVVEVVEDQLRQKGPHLCVSSLLQGSLQDILVGRWANHLYP